MQIKDRIKELRRVTASELIPNPKNWRTHPQAQSDALKGILSEVGIAGAVLARELDDGSLMLIDGHLRAETIGAGEVPVLILDVTESEADKLLASLDPLGAMAGSNAQALDVLLREVQTGSQGLAKMLSDLAESAGVIEKEIKKESVPIADQVFNIIVICQNEKEQGELLLKLSEEGHECRSLIS